MSKTPEPFHFITNNLTIILPPDEYDQMFDTEKLTADGALHYSQGYFQLDCELWNDVETDFGHVYNKIRQLLKRLINETEEDYPEITILH